MLMTSRLRPFGRTVAGYLFLATSCMPCLPYAATRPASRLTQWDTKLPKDQSIKLHVPHVRGPGMITRQASEVHKGTMMMCQTNCRLVTRPSASLYCCKHCLECALHYQLVSARMNSTQPRCLGCFQVYRPRHVSERSGAVVGTQMHMIPRSSG